MAVKVGATPLAFAAAGLIAVAIPVWLLMPVAGAPAVAEADVPAPVAAPQTAAPLSRVYERPLFGTAQPDALPADAPQLLGIAGRLGSDAVALVRTAQGGTRTLAIGDSVDGWTLESLAIDAALFTRGGQRARVPLPGDQ